VHDDASHNPEFTKSVEGYAYWLREKSAEQDQAYAWGMYENERSRAAKAAKATAAHSLDLRAVDPVVQVRRTLAGVRILCDECALARCASHARASSET
jgi:hypothetical protein